VDFEVMFIRFVGAEIDERSRVPAGLFCAVSQLRWSEGLPDYEFEALTELKDWFNFICTHPSIVCHAIGAMNKRFVGSSQPPVNILSERGS